jgi:hypothetical protein
MCPVPIQPTVSAGRSVRVIELPIRFGNANVCSVLAAPGLSRDEEASRRGARARHEICTVAAISG